MIKALDDAMRHGIYPGWEKDITNQEGHPVPLASKNKHGEIKIAKKRTENAESRIGRHLITLFFDGIQDLDLHNQVCF